MLIFSWSWCCSRQYGTLNRWSPSSLVCHLAQECPVPPSSLSLHRFYFLNKCPVFLIILWKVIWIQHIPILHLCIVGSLGVGYGF